MARPVHISDACSRDTPAALVASVLFDALGPLDARCSFRLRQRKWTRARLEPSVADFAGRLTGHGQRSAVGA